jgi:hypothetical protein
MLVDPFLADVHDLFISASTNGLLRTLVQTDQTLNQLQVFWFDPGYGFIPSLLGESLGLFRSISSPTTIPLEIPVDSGFIHTDCFGNL